MKPLRLAVIGIAGLAGLAAVMLSGRNEPQGEVAAAPDNANLTEILVAKADLPVGTAVVGEEQLTWAKWPQTLASGTMILRTARPDAITEFKGSIVRQPFFVNEPIREEKLIKANGSGFLSAILPSGKRGVAIAIDNTGATTAGGFILPNDYVDVLVTEDSNGSPKTSTILSNIRVLAIGQNVQEKDGERFIVGQTATLQLDPDESEIVILNQKRGSLSLILRSLQDVRKLEVRHNNARVTVVRSGIIDESAK